MRINFFLTYKTTYGEQLVLNLLGEGHKPETHTMHTQDGEHWHVELSKALKAGSYIDYYYSVCVGENIKRQE